MTDMDKPDLEGGSSPELEPSTLEAFNAGIAQPDVESVTGAADRHVAPAQYDHCRFGDL